MGTETDGRADPAGRTEGKRAVMSDSWEGEIRGLDRRQEGK